MLYRGATRALVQTGGITDRQRLVRCASQLIEYPLAMGQRPSTGGTDPARRVPLSEVDTEQSSSLAIKFYPPRKSFKGVCSLAIGGHSVCRGRPRGADSRLACGLCVCIAARVSQLTRSLAFSHMLPKEPNDAEDAAAS